jgi:hypothetical protein
LGIVDLFACEISTLCRVGSVLDLGKFYVELFNAAPAEERGATDVPAEGSAAFVSREDYFPVFQSNLRDLQLLEASVVTYITAFSTFMKAARDAQRHLAQTEPPPSAGPGAPDANTVPDPRHRAISSKIHAFPRLREWAQGRRGPDRIRAGGGRKQEVILLTELKCCCFLLKYFEQDELRHARLELRKEPYTQEVKDLYCRLNAPHGDNDKYWEPAKRTAPELRRRYNEALGEDLVVGAVEWKAGQVPEAGSSVRAAAARARSG